MRIETEYNAVDLFSCPTISITKSIGVSPTPLRTGKGILNRADSSATDDIHESHVISFPKAAIAREE